MTLDQERYGERVFSKDHVAEAARLAAIAQTYDPSSQALLTRLGVSTGWHCADVGCGVGTVAAWLASQAAPGQVVAIDRDPRLLDKTMDHHQNLRVVTADVTTDHGSLGGFDLVYARFLL